MIANLLKRELLFFYTMRTNLIFYDNRCKNFGRISSSSYQVRTRFDIYRFALWHIVRRFPVISLSVQLLMHVHIYYISYSIYISIMHREHEEINGMMHERDTKPTEKNYPRRSAYRDRLVANFRLCSCKLIDAISRNILPKHATLRRVSSVHFIQLL